MRLRFLLVPLSVVFATWSCQSTVDQRTAEPNETSTSADDGLAREPHGEPSEQPNDSAAVQDAAVVDAAAPRASQDSQELLGQEGQRLELIRQRQQSLADQYIANGDRLLDQADLAGALEQFSQALDVMPSNETARARIRRVESLMGEGFAGAAQGFQDLQQQEVVRRAQARMSAEDAMIRGQNAMSRGEYDAAVDAFREAQLILRYHPLVGNETLDERVATGMLDDALARQAEARAATLEQERQQAEVERERREREQREYRENRLRTLYQKAHQSFLSDDYGQAEALANQILLEDPGNEHAIRLRDTAQAAKHAKADEVLRRNYREQWRRTFDELDTLDVPQVDPLVFDELERWNEVAERRPLEFGTADPRLLQDKEAVIARLESVRFAPRFVGADGGGAPLAQIAAFLQNLSGVNFLISPKVAELDEEAQTIKLDLPERSVRQVLDLIAETSESIRWKVEDGVVKFVTPEELVGGQILKMYSVQDLIHPVPNFAGREINVSPSGGLEQPEDNTPQREGLVVTSDALEALIRDNISPASWNDDPKNSVRITEAGTMVVNQTPEVQEQIQGLLDDLREATGIMVDIQARFLKVEDNFLEDIGVDFRGLGQPGQGTNTFLNDFGDPSTQQEFGQEIGQDTDLGAFYDEGGDGDIRSRVENLYDLSLGDENTVTASGGLSFQWTYLNDLQAELVLRAVAKSERVELVTAPRLLVFNTARANLAVLNQVAYVKDFDVEIAQAASIADPIVDVIQDGVVLDVRPVVSADRRFIMMELRPTVAELRRPIDEIPTSLGSQNSVSLQLPQVDIQRVRTTVPMPDGGTVLLGGLKVSEKRDLRSGVPLLNKIPLVRFLFERKGTYNSNRKLLILLKAGIVIASELEPTPAQMQQE